VHAARELDDGLVADFFVSQVVALDLGIDVLASEGAQHAVQHRGVALRSAVASGPYSSPVRQIRPPALFRDFLGVAAEGSFLGDAQLGQRDQAAEILVALPVAHQQWIASAVGAVTSRRCARRHRPSARHVESRSTIDAVEVEEGHGMLLLGGALRGVFLRQCSALQEAEADVHGVRHSVLLSPFVRRTLLFADLSTDFNGEHATAKKPASSVRSTGFACAFIQIKGDSIMSTECWIANSTGRDIRRTHLLEPPPWLSVRRRRVQ